MKYKSWSSKGIQFFKELLATKNEVMTIKRRFELVPFKDWDRNPTTADTII